MLTRSCLVHLTFKIVFLHVVFSKPCGTHHHPSRSLAPHRLPVPWKRAPRKPALKQLAYRWLMTIRTYVH
jgi:hypothetical protein